MRLTLNDPETNWKFVGIVLVVGLATAGGILFYL